MTRLHRKLFFFNLRFSIRFTVVSLLALVCFVVAAITVSLQYHYSTLQFEQNALKDFEQVVAQTKESLQNKDAQAKQLVDLLAIYPEIESQPHKVKLELMTEMMSHHPLIFGLYIAAPDGQFFEVVNLTTAGARNQYFADNNDAWLVLEINPSLDSNIQTLTYYDHNLQPTNLVEKQTSYNPVVRPWYTQAKAVTALGDPYLFQFSQLPGVTYSKKLADNRGVIGLDVSLNNLSQSLAKYANTFSGEAYITKQNGELVAQYNSTALNSSLTHILPSKLSINQRNYIDQLSSISVSNGEDWQPIDFSLSGVPKVMLLIF